MLEVAQRAGREGVKAGVVGGEVDGGHDVVVSRGTLVVATVVV